MVGHEVENFRLKDQHGNIFDLYENLDKKVLLIFYPKDNTAVCSSQLRNYQFHESKFQSKGIRLVGINIADSKSHKVFCEEINIDFQLLSDENKTISRRFGALNLLGSNKRKLVLIDTNKEIVLEEEVSYFSYPSADEIINRIEVLKT